MISKSDNFSILCLRLCTFNTILLKHRCCWQKNSFMYITLRNDFGIPFITFTDARVLPVYNRTILIQIINYVYDVSNMFSAWREIQYVASKGFKPWNRHVGHVTAICKWGLRILMWHKLWSILWQVLLLRNLFDQ